MKQIIDYVNSHGRFISSNELIENAFWFSLSSYISLINPIILYKNKQLKVNYFGISIAGSASGKSFVYEQIKKLFDIRKWEKALFISYLKANEDIPNEIIIEGEKLDLKKFLPNFENNIEGTKEGLYLRALALSKCFVGSLNIIHEEIMDVIKDSNLNVMKELYDGRLLGKVIKGNINENIYGIISNMFIFGSSIGLKRDSKTYETFIKAMNSGIYRRSFIYYEEPREIKLNNLEPIKLNLDYINETISNNKQNITTGMPYILEPTQETIEYLELINQELIEFSSKYKDDERFSAEIGSFDKILKLAGLHSIYKNRNKIEYDDIYYAYNFYKRLRDTNKNLFNVEPQHKRIYKIIKANKKLTKSEILEKDIFNRVTFNEDIKLVEEICYRNNERLVVTGSKIKFYSIEPMEKNNLNKIIVSTPRVDKKEKTTEYNSFELPMFDSEYSIENLVKANTISNFCLVHFENGKRKKDNVISKINCIGIDIDFGSLNETLDKLKDVCYLIYTTKSHRKEKNGVISDRFRILLPLSNIVEIEPDRYEILLDNICNALDLKMYDKNAKDISRLWFVNPNAEIYKNKDGNLFNPIPFMPDTVVSEKIESVGSKFEINSNEEVNKRLNGFIRWIIGQTYQGNRNSNLLKLGLFAYDLLGSKELAKQLVLEVNQMINEPLEEREIRKTILKTIERK